MSDPRRHLSNPEGEGISPAEPLTFQGQPVTCGSNFKSVNQNYKSLQSPFSVSLSPLGALTVKVKGLHHEKKDINAINDTSKPKSKNSQDDSFPVSKTNINSPSSTIPGRNGTGVVKEYEKTGPYEIDSKSKDVLPTMKLANKQILTNTETDNSASLLAPKTKGRKPVELTKWPMTSSLDISTVTMEENDEFERNNLILEDGAKQVLLKMQQKGVFEQFDEQCFADSDAKAEEVNLTIKVENMLEKLLMKNTDWISKDISRISEDELDEYILEYFYTCFDLDLDSVVDRVVDSKISPLISISEAEFDLRLGIAKPKEIDYADMETESSEMAEIINENPGCSQSDDEEFIISCDEVDIEDDEEESPAFEKIGETPPASPQRLAENVENLKKVSPELSLQEKKENDAKQNLCDSQQLKLRKSLLTEIPEDVDGIPVFYLELSDMLTEKLKFFNDLKREHEDDSSLSSDE